jgi:hypothetical protein
MQGPITPGVTSEKRPPLPCQTENPRRMGPCVRRDDSLENSIAIAVRPKDGNDVTSERVPLFHLTTSAHSGQVRSSIGTSQAL